MVVDLLAAAADAIGDLFDGADAAPSAPPPATPPSEVHFGGGRWEGTDRWGNPVEQSSTGGPVHANSGAAVDPLDVTWKS